MFTPVLTLTLSQRPPSTFPRTKNRRESSIPFCFSLSFPYNGRRRRQTPLARTQEEEGFLSNYYCSAAPLRFPQHEFIYYAVTKIKQKFLSVASRYSTLERCFLAFWHFRAPFLFPPWRYGRYPRRQPGGDKGTRSGFSATISVFERYSCSRFPLCGENSIPRSRLALCNSLCIFFSPRFLFSEPQLWENRRPGPLNSDVRKGREEKPQCK